MVQKRETKANNKLCVCEVLSLSFVCGAYFFEFRGRNLVCFVIAYNFNGKYAPEAGKTRMCTAFFFFFYKCNICSRYCIYHVKFTSYCELIECSRPMRFFIVSVMYNNKSYYTNSRI